MKTNKHYYDYFCYINQNLIGSRLVRDLSIIWAMHFFALISEGARGWLWFLGNLVTGLWYLRCLS